VRVLFVAPVEGGSGETITALHMAENIISHGGDAFFLASLYASEFLGGRLPGRVERLTHSLEANVALWDQAVVALKPEAIVFADFPLLFFSFGVSPLAPSERWLDGLSRAPARLVTLDHSGLAQRPQAVFFGPPHLSQSYEMFPALPERMDRLLPCPMHEPHNLEWRRGRPFRYWDLPLGIPALRRQAVRESLGVAENDLLIFHSVPTWAWRAAEEYRLPFFSFLPELLEHYLSSLPCKATVVSVNNGSLLPAPPGCLRIVNFPPQSPSVYEELMFSADLMITDNKISISMGKAICGLVPCAAFRNSYTLLQLMGRLRGPLREMVLSMERSSSGSVFPYEVFPSGMMEELLELGLYRESSLADAFEELEIFGGELTREALHRLLLDETVRAQLRSRQAEYVRRVRELEDAHSVLQLLIDESPY
jgi:hypothetical protein